jgi:hypothetical protein
MPGLGQEAAFLRKHAGVRTFVVLREDLPDGPHTYPLYGIAGVRR